MAFSGKQLVGAVRLTIALWGLLLAVFVASPTSAAEPPTTDGQPNIVIFFIDDLGRCDLGVDGSTFYETPQLDALAAAGVRFTDFYAACAVCSPTRAALMTGKVPQRLGITDWIHPASGVALPGSETTLAEAFQAGGYQTAYLGKWHLGETDADQPPRHGFEWIKGVNRAGQPGSYYFPFKRPNGDSKIWDVPDFADGNPSDYLTDVLTTGAIEFLNTRDASRPFLLCMGHYAVHTPIQPPTDGVSKYQQKRAACFGDSPTPTIPTLFKAGSRGRQDDPPYAAMIENLDDNVGRVLAALDKLGLRENTIVVFTSDNGGLCTTAGRRPGPTCNLPYRGGKGWNYEGGIRVSTLIAWPGHLRPATTSVPAFTADLYPTLLELCGMPLRPAQHVDGQSLVSAMQGDPRPALRERALAWYYPHDHGSGHRPSAAIRRGDWKLIHYLKEGRTELYDLAADPGELHDLAESRADKVSELRGELLRWIDETTQ
ncbi:MAG: sulfatase [Pirellulales bacterium]